VSTALSEVAVGDTVPALSLRVTRAGLVRYAAASGDLNPIHWSDRVAAAVGLPGVIAHGMLTMALAVRLVTTWTGDPSSVVGYGTRFTRPVVVPDDDEGVALEVTGTVKAVADPPADDPTAARTATVLITATVDGKTVLGRATAQVRLPA
jgi:acyl dehydratase